MSKGAELCAMIAQQIEQAEIQLNKMIRDQVREKFGLDPLEVEFQGGLFEAGFQGTRTEVEVRLKFLLPVSFPDWEAFADWNDDPEKSERDLREWGFWDLIMISENNVINYSEDPPNQIFLEVEFSESSIEFQSQEAL
jgi:hypothetical protein